MLLSNGATFGSNRGSNNSQSLDGQPNSWTTRLKESSHNNSLSMIGCKTSEPNKKYY